jgi:hypothetical protein
MLAILYLHKHVCEAIKKRAKSSLVIFAQQFSLSHTRVKRSSAFYQQLRRSAQILTNHPLLHVDINMDLFVVQKV